MSQPQTRRCSEYEPLRRAYFGDLHVHTRLSLDATAFGTRTTPKDAYRFARGEEIDIPPYTRDGRPRRRLRIDRPLDFAAVTDHAEFLGELFICENEDQAGYHSAACVIYRRWPTLAHFLAGQRGAYLEEPKRYRMCGPDAEHCLEASETPWRAIIAAAEEHYDRSEACHFTTFVGYEWTGSPNSDNLHRNVIFRSAKVPKRPISYSDAPRISELWSGLEESCTSSVPGCDFLAIPHNSNLSGGRMFEPVAATGGAMDAQYARRRSRIEPLVELIQHKGESECRDGLGNTDELCNFEQLPFANFYGISLGLDQEHPELNYVRNALKEGLVQEHELGSNPFELGFIGSTDTHFAIPGAVSERDFAGHMYPGHTPESLPERIAFNPGGLAVLWAEQNSREALFDAMRRRESYATSGPRIRLRFFGGWELPEEMCQLPNFARPGYAGGSPMGGRLSPGPPAAAGEHRAPRFAVRALRDPGTSEQPGGQLQRIQIIKGWVEDGRAHEQVFDVAGDPDNGADVNLDTCAPRGPGAADLCTVWTDPKFDPTQPSFYYARVLENPSCRWSTWACNAQGVECSQDGNAQHVPRGLRDCCDPDYPRSIQERAWSSPIWYSP